MTIHPYESEFMAQEAAEISEEVMEHWNERKKYDIYILQKKENPNKKIEKLIRDKMEAKVPYTIEVDEGEEWDVEWTKVYDIIEHKGDEDDEY